MGVIPDLPDDVGLDCLVRVPHQCFPSVAAVCRSWRREIRLPEFWRRRKAVGSTREVVVMVQERVDPNREAESEKDAGPGTIPGYRMTIFEPGTGYWAELPPIPGCTDGLPMFCRVTAVALGVVVIGGWNPVTGEVSDRVFVYDFVTAAWRRGAAMPGRARSFFACASDFSRKVYVAGGHDGDKCALRSAMAYDVATDEWCVLPDMATERDEAKGVFHRGKFHVISGYETGSQGRFTASAESFDSSKWQWDSVEDSFLDDAMCPKNCVEIADGDLFMCRGADVMCRRGVTWQVVAELPADVRNTVSYVTAWRGGVLVIGCKNYVLDLKGKKWAKIEEFAGHVQTGCCLEL